LPGTGSCGKSDGTDAGNGPPFRTGFFRPSAELSGGGGTGSSSGRATSRTAEELWTSDGTNPRAPPWVADINPRRGASLDVPGLSSLHPGRPRRLLRRTTATHGPGALGERRHRRGGRCSSPDLNPGTGGSLGNGQNLFGPIPWRPPLAGVGPSFAAYGPSGWGALRDRRHPRAERPQLQNLNTQALGARDPRRFIDRGGTPLFRADDGATGTELWKERRHGRRGPRSSRTLHQVPDSIPIGGVDGDRLHRLFFTTTSFPSGLGPVDERTATAAGTRSVVPAAYANSPARKRMGGDRFLPTKVLYAQPDGQVLHLWKVDPTGASASLVQSFGRDRTGSRASIPVRQRPGRRFPLFSPPRLRAAPLYRSDGTAAGTIPVAPGPFFSGPMSRLGAGPAPPSSPPAGQVFVSDGTAAGHKGPGLPLCRPLAWSRRVGKVFFLAYDFAVRHVGALGERCTGAGTHIVKDIQHGFASSSSLDLRPATTVFFVADDGPSTAGSCG